MMSSTAPGDDGRSEAPLDVLVLAPTSRLARAERQRLAVEAAASTRSAWRTPDVLSVGAWRARLRSEALLAGAVDQVVIGDDASRELWRAVIDTQVFVGEPRVVDLAQRAWRTLHEYRLSSPDSWPELLLSDDSRAFRGWAARFRAACAERDVIDEWAFAAALPGLIRDGRLPLPARVRRVGFELEPVPLLAAVFDALADAGVEIEPIGSSADSPAALPVQDFADGDAELRAAAEWARNRLEREPGARIGIVVPDLGERMTRAERIFAEVFDPPGFALSEARGDTPWHVSIGPALADWPLVGDALLLLGLSPNRIDQPVAGRVTRSPWLLGWQAERSQRAQAEVDLMRRAPYSLTQHEWVFALKRARATDLAVALERWRPMRIDHQDAAWPSTWTERFQSELTTLGFGHGRPLNSREFQALRRWHELLEAFAALDVTASGPIPRHRALARLAERARDARFREADPGSPVELLGVQEAIGARFDAAWLTTLDRDTWPSSARRDPLIPGPIQQSVPTSTSEGCRARAADELAGLLRIAPELRGSFARGEDEIPRRCTPLLQIEPDGDSLQQAMQASTRESLERPGVDAPASAILETIAEDRSGPALSDSEVHGGTSVLRDQSACPFRAFAVHRLAARDVPAPRPGLDAALRGTLLHRALEAFWRDLSGRDALRALDAADLAARIENAAGHAIDSVLQHHRLTLGRVGRRLEQQCTERLLARWIEIEKARGDFHVEAREARIAMRFGPIELTGTVDRVDATEQGPVLIDYKTGATGRNDWRPAARIVDPQLPAYALSMQPPPVALAFGRLRPERLGFEGLAAEPVDIEGIDALDRATGSWKAFDDFDALRDDWRRALDALAADFAEGRAAVDPRDDRACRHCHLHAFCRIHERVSKPSPGPAVDVDVRGDDANGSDR